MTKKTKTLNQKEILFPIVFGIILVLQIAMMFYWGIQKVGYHPDEVYTMTLSTDVNAVFHENTDHYDHWITGDYIKSQLVADGDELFNFSFVYHNQESDVHPPLYYFFINIAMSLCSGVLSKWVGIVPNMIFSLLTSIVLYHTAKKLTKNKYLALVCTAFFAVNVGTMSSVVFIRMYALFMLWVICFIYCHLTAFERFLQSKITRKTYLALFLLTVCGILTHYYFLFICLFTCGIFCIFLLFQKSYKTFLCYACTELGALLFSVAFFPTMIYHLFSGSRGAEAVANLGQIEGTLTDLRKVLTVISNDLMGGFTTEIILLFVCAILLYGANYLRKNKGAYHSLWQSIASIFSDKHHLFVCGLFAVIIGYIAFVVQVAPYQYDRYYMCLFPLLILGFFYCLYNTIHLYSKRDVVSFALTALCAVVLTLASHQSASVGYLYESEASRAVLSEYQDTPVIVVSSEDSNGVLKFLPELTQYQDVFVCYYSFMEHLSEAYVDGILDDGFLFYFTNIYFDDETVEYVMNTYLGVTEYYEVIDNVYYCMP